MPSWSQLTWQMQTDNKPARMPFFHNTGNDMHETLKAIETIQKTQRRIAVTSGVIMGVLMSVYFFSFAMLIDRGMFGALLVEIITSIAFVIAYIFMNTLSFRLTRLLLSRRHGQLLNRLTARDIYKSPEQVLESLNDNTATP